ncbi:MAG: BrnT family toxin [Bradyrhizobiaceae bacterium]|nr:BrnT family toxin [Bradyrhizobiaceae bacterium]
MSDANDHYRERPVEWDENKRQANVAKHGIDFADALAVFSDPRCRVYGPRAGYGEARFVAIGTSAGRVIAVVFTERGEAVRIISARAARRNERSLYEQV